MKALVAETVHAAKQGLAALGLPLSEWTPVGWFDACTGRRFEKIVAVEPKGDGWTEQHVRFLNEVLKTRLPPGGRIHFL